MPVILNTGHIYEEDPKLSRYVGCFDGSVYIDGKKTFPSYAERAGIISKDGRLICMNCPQSMITKDFCDENEEPPDILFCKELGYPCDQIKKCPVWMLKPVSDIIK